MSDDRDFIEPAPVTYATGTSSALTLGTPSITYNNSGWSPSISNYAYSSWPNVSRTLTLKLKPSKELSVTEYYEEVYKLMSLLKDTSWNITSTKVKS